MKEVINFGDIIEENGKTIRENRRAIPHTIGLGALVEVTPDSTPGPSDGLRMFVQAHIRDCDGTPLYTLTHDYKTVGRDYRNAPSFDESIDSLLKRMLWEREAGSIRIGFPKESLVIIKSAEEVAERMKGLL